MIPYVAPVTKTDFNIWGFMSFKALNIVFVRACVFLWYLGLDKDQIFLFDPFYFSKEIQTILFH